MSTFLDMKLRKSQNLKKKQTTKTESHAHGKQYIVLDTMCPFLESKSKYKSKQCPSHSQVPPNKTNSITEMNLTNSVAENSVI